MTKKKRRRMRKKMIRRMRRKMIRKMRRKMRRNVKKGKNVMKKKTRRKRRKRKNLNLKKKKTLIRSLKLNPTPKLITQKKKSMSKVLLPNSRRCIKISTISSLRNTMISVKNLN